MTRVQVLRFCLEIVVALASLGSVLGVFLRPLRAQDAAPAKSTESPASPATDSDQNAAAPNPKPQRAEPKIIIAEHVLMWDDRIMNWDSIVARLRLLRRDQPVHPTFYTTNGVSAKKDEGWQFWHDRIMKVYPELFQPAGVTFGSLSPRGSKLYDAIKTEDDLRPNPALARSGQVLDPQGNPARGAQVVVLPIKDNLPLALKGTSLRDPHDERWTQTDERGRFTIYPREDEYFVAVLHASGFALHRGTDKDKQAEPELTLAPWAIIKFSTLGDVGKQTAAISARPEGSDLDWPTLELYDVKATAGPIDVPVPPGKLSVSRTLPMKEGSSISLPVETFSLQPGEERIIQMKPATDDDRKQAADLYEMIHGKKP